MKIVFFIGSLEHGGAEKVVSMLSNDFSDNGIQIEIALLLSNTVNHQHYQLRDNIKIVNLSPSSKGYIRNSFFWLRKIRKYLKESKPDKVVSFIGRINCLVLTASLGTKIPIYVSERNDPKHDGRGKFFSLYCNFIYKKAKKIIFQTKYEMMCFSKAIQKKGVVLPNPVERTFFWKKTFSDSFLIVNTARLNEQKNHFLMLKTIARLQSEGHKVKCIIYGEGELRSKMESFIKANNLETAVLLPGNISNVCEKIKDANVFVQTSFFEGLSNSLIEAMRMGMPTICTNYPGVEEIIVNGENGIIIPQNSINDLHDKILLLMDNDLLTDKLSANAAKTTERFAPNVVIRRWKEEIGI